tara:strand:- start:170 stop:337 length:168 start_codon:yes stop_codon:yes gene_type:complete
VAVAAQVMLIQILALVEPLDQVVVVLDQLLHRVVVKQPQTLVRVVEVIMVTVALV